MSEEIQTQEQVSQTPDPTAAELRESIAAATALLNKIEPPVALPGERPPAAGMMKTATLVLRMHKDSSVVKVGVTPAQAMLLTSIHLTGAGKDPIENIVETESVKRTNVEEVRRLRGIYGDAKVKSLFGPNSPLPQTFNDALIAGKSWAMEQPEESGPALLVGRAPTAAENAASL